MTRNAAAAAVWIPPGTDGLTPHEAAGLKELLERAANPAVARTVLDIADRFEAARPAEPHFHLTLLATHDRHRGHGLGMGLLADRLDRIDALGSPAYLESSNPANLARYASVGFTARDRVTTPPGRRRRRGRGAFGSRNGRSNPAAGVEAVKL